MSFQRTLEPVAWHRSFDVVEACRRSREIDERLVKILGGLPVPRAPRGRVVELPAGRVVDVFEKAAA